MTPEQKQQRIEQIRERHSGLHADAQQLGDDWCTGTTVLNDIDFLLSLVKSQEADLTEAQERTALDKSIKGTMAKHAGDAGARVIQLERELESVATSMRSACVEKVRAMGQQWYAEAKKRGAAFSDKGRLAEMIANELESVSIQEQK